MLRYKHLKMLFLKQVGKAPVWDTNQKCTLNRSNLVPSENNSESIARWCVFSVGGKLLPCFSTDYDGVASPTDYSMLIVFFNCSRWAMSFCLHLDVLSFQRWLHISHDQMRFLGFSSSQVGYIMPWLQTPGILPRRQTIGAWSSVLSVRWHTSITM